MLGVAQFGMEWLLEQAQPEPHLILSLVWSGIRGSYKEILDPFQGKGYKISSYYIFKVLSWIINIH